MSDAAEIAQALREAEADPGATFTWQTNSYACCASPLARGTTLELGGFAADIDLRIVVRAELFTGSRPIAGQLITYNGASYRIERVTTHEAFLRLFCISKNK